MAIDLRELKTGAIIFLALCLLAIGSCMERHVAHAQTLDNSPLDSLGVSGYDSTLCNDLYNTCSSYDRIEFEYIYPGQFDTLGRFPADRSDLYDAGSPSGYVPEERWHSSYESGSSSEHASEFSPY